MKRSISGMQLATMLSGWQGGASPPSAYVRLATALRHMVLDGRVATSVRLPSERSLAEALGVSRTTVTAAYRLLREGGFVRSRQGGGTWTALPPGRQRRFAPWGPAGPDDPDWLDLALASPSGDETILVALKEALGHLGSRLAGTGYEPYGVDALRDVIARRYQARGVPTTAEQILVTSGAQQAIDIVVRTLVGPLDPVVVECPTYPNALDVLLERRARIVPVGMSPSGWDPDLFVSALRQGLPRLAYLIPDFQNPTGHLMDDSCRQAIAAAAEVTGTIVVADETFCELFLDDQALPAPFASHSDRAISIGSASKAYWAGLRVGWIRADTETIGRLQQARARCDMAGPILEQLAVGWLLDHGEELLARRRAFLAHNRDLLVGLLHDNFADWAVGAPGGGLSLWVTLPAPISTALTHAAIGHRLRLAAGPRFGPAGTLEGRLRLPFTLEADDLVEAVTRLGAARADLDAGWHHDAVDAPAVA